MIGTAAPTNAHFVAAYHPLPWQVAPWRDRSRVVLLTGSAGGGKSRLAAEKLHGYCLKYPGAFALVARKTRASLTKGTVLFLDRTVIGADPNVEHLPSKDYFVYRNGSILAYLGLEDKAQRERLKSIGPRGGVDIAWGEEATELEEEDHNALLGRLRGTAADWRQILYTCNPDAPTHWIKRRLMDGKEAAVYYSKAADNRHNPADYLDTLNSLTGIDDLRLNRGLWVIAQGAVYANEWVDGGEGGNVTEAAEYEPDAGAVYWALDDGYSAGSAPSSAGRDRQGMYVADAHPRVILWCQARPDGRLVVFDESYACLTLSDVHIAEALRSPYPRPDYVVHGPGSAEIKGRLFEAGLTPAQSTADVAESIKELRRRIAPDARGWRGILVHPRCVHLRGEMASYANDPTTGKPIKAYDHGPDALRGLVWRLRGQL